MPVGDNDMPGLVRLMVLRQKGMPLSRTVDAAAEVCTAAVAWRVH